MLNIDGTEYSKAGEFSCSHGSGESRESWSYIVLQGPECEEDFNFVLQDDIHGLSSEVIVELVDGLVGVFESFFKDRNRLRVSFGLGL